MLAFNQEGEVQAIELCQLIAWHQSFSAADVQRAAQPRGAVCLWHLQVLLCPPVSGEDLGHPTGDRGTRVTGTRLFFVLSHRLNPSVQKPVHFINSALGEEEKKSSNKA